MGNPTDTAVNLLHRAEEALKRRRRRVVPAEEATLAAMAESPRATVGLTDEQRRQLAEIENSPVAAA